MATRDVRFSILTLAALAALSTAAHADVFRCVGADGKTLYSDAPCPENAVQKSNITDAVGACNTAECASKHQQTVNDALERLRAEKTELADMTQKRLERERVSFEEQRWRQAIESQMAASAEQAALAAGNPVYYPAYPTAAGWPCRGSRCSASDRRRHPAHPGKPPHVSHHQQHRQQVGLPIRLER
jgi:hypothetical protein